MNHNKIKTFSNADLSTLVTRVEETGECVAKISCVVARDLNISLQATFGYLIYGLYENGAYSPTSPVVEDACW